MKLELFVLLDVSDNITYSLELLCLLICNLDAKLLLELHNELYSVQRICAEVASEGSLWGNLRLLNALLVNNDLYNFLLNL